jgi:cytochrome P450
MDMQAPPGHAAPRLVPPVPVPPEKELPTLRFIAAMRVNGIACWPASAYEAPLRRRRLLGRTRFTVSDPDLVRHVLVDNAANYARTPITIRMLRPMLGDGLLISEGTAWRHQRRALAPAFTPRAVETLVPHILSASDEAVAALEGPAISRASRWSAANRSTGPRDRSICSPRSSGSPWRSPGAPCSPSAWPATATACAASSKPTPRGSGART